MIMPLPEDRYLGPRKKWGNGAKRPHKAGFRHLPWLVPTAACAVFAILITGAVTVRMVIVRRVAAPADTSSESPTQPPVASNQASKQGTIVPSAPGSSDETEPAVLQVLPPLAAKQPGRKLPKLLLVGDQPDMFPDLNSALEAAIAGDEIEIRTNHPILLKPHVLDRTDQTNDHPLTIRGGPGFEPVIRTTLESTIFSHGVTLRIDRLHFVTPAVSGRGEGILWTDSSIAVTDCSLTDLPGTHPEERSLVQFQQPNPLGPDQVAKIAITNCFFRGTHAFPCRYLPGRVQIQISNCLCLGLGAVVGYSSNLPQNVLIRLSRNTLTENASLILSLADESPVIAQSLLRIEADSNIIATHNYALNLQSRSADLADWQSRGNLSWTGDRNLFFPHTLLECNREGEDQRTLATNLEEWRRFWNAKPDANSHQAAIEFIQPRRWEERATSLPADYAIKSVEGLRPDQWQGIGCDVAKLPVPPPVTLEPYDVHVPQVDADRK